jgi:hypothetical protein
MLHALGDYNSSFAQFSLARPSPVSLARPRPGAAPTTHPILRGVEYRQSEIPTIAPKYRTSRGDEENDMKRFNLARHAQRSLSTHSRIHNHFKLHRHRLSAKQHRAARDAGFRTWRDVAGGASEM